MTWRLALLALWGLSCSGAPEEMELGQSVVFEPDSLAAAGAAIEVAYGPVGLCD